MFTHHLRRAIRPALLGAVLVPASLGLASTGSAQGGAGRYFLGCWAGQGPGYTAYTRLNPGGFYVSRLVRQVRGARYVLTIQGRWWVRGNVLHVQETSILPRGHRKPFYQRYGFRILGRSAVRLGNGVIHRRAC